jgi:hypothetical protein
MRIKIIILIVLVVFAGYSYAANLSQPPIDRKMPIQTRQYLKEIADKNNIFEVTTTAPNGSRRGKKGEGIIYDDSGTLELWVNYDGDTTWQKI